MSFSIDSSISRSRRAQSNWCNRPIRDRLAFVRRLRHILCSAADRLCLTATQDIGRPASDVLATDLIPTLDALRFLERRAENILRPRRIQSSDRPWWLFGEREAIHRRPHGVVGIIGTWNYPILLNIVTIAQALVAGNGVVWKPSELVPTLAELVHEMFESAGLPEDVFVRRAATREAGPELVESEIDYLVFTGSADVGRKIAARLGQRLIPCTLELSGCDALYVLDDADVALAADAAWFAATLNVGQTCLAVRRAFVHRQRYDEFVAAIQNKTQARRPEPLALLSQATQAERLIRDAVSSGARVLGDGPLPVADDDPPRFPPTVLIDCRPEMLVCQEASFAPILSVIPFDAENELPAMTEACSYGLGASIFTADHRRGERLATRLRVGSVSINDVIVGTAHPAIGFGGIGESGWGVTRGEEGLLAMTFSQAVTRRSGRFRLHFHSDDPAVPDVTRGLLDWSHAPTFRGRLAGFWRMVSGFRRFGRG